MQVSEHTALLALLTSLVAVTASSAIAPPPAGKSGWICQGVDGAFVSAHERQSEALASCSRRAKAAEGGIFIVLAGPYPKTPAPVPQPVILKSPECQPPKSCPTSLPLSGQRGAWTWVAPTALEHGNIQTDLVRFVMYRKPLGGDADVFANIDRKATNVIWGMDTREANACFWIEAVRVRSAAMPSDRSNTICMDAQGQPLPKT